MILNTIEIARVGLQLVQLEDSGVVILDRGCLKSR